MSWLVRLYAIPSSMDDSPHISGVRKKTCVYTYSLDRLFLVGK